MSATKPKRVEFIKMLAEKGYEDSIVVRKETAREVLTDERLKLLDQIREKTNSINGLARDLERDPAAVKRDLDILFKHDLIKYKKDGNKKLPILKHNHIFVEPI